jgi:hypothetical protein
MFFLKDHESEIIAFYQKIAAEVFSHIPLIQYEENGYQGAGFYVYFHDKLASVYLEQSCTDMGNCLKTIITDLAIKMLSERYDIFEEMIPERSARSFFQCGLDTKIFDTDDTVSAIFNPETCAFNWDTYREYRRVFLDNVKTRLTEDCDVKLHHVSVNSSIFSSSDKTAWMKFFTNSKKDIVDCCDKKQAQIFPTGVEIFHGLKEASDAFREQMIKHLYLKQTLVC